MKPRIRILTAATLLTTSGLTVPAQAQNYAPITGLLETQQCQGCYVSIAQPIAPRESVVAMPLGLSLSCVESVLTSRGESIFRVDREQGVVTTSLRSVEPEELQQIADTQQAGGRIRWTQGSYQLFINLSPVNKQRTKVQVSTRILGSGETSLPLMRPSMLRPLPSTGMLEGDILAALASQCGRRTNR
jgi:hypothetical protein